ncbi:MAG: hypothetical protein D6791_11310 [Chloroflexi bacterium]|nr:MAG: hypothetical protein D6791_11310 [Chloroflexota bacterium]
MSQRYKRSILVTVFGHSGQEVCLISGCGAEVGSAEAAGELHATLNSLFGDRVAVRYYDLAEPDLAQRFADVLEGARDRNLPFPLIAIDNEIVLAGPVGVETVLQKLNEFVTQT